MNSLVFTLIFPLLGISASGITIPDLEQCPAQKNSVYKLSVVSRRNQTGQWNAQVSFNHGAVDNEDGPWELDIEQRTAKCGRLEMISIDADLSSPASVMKSPRRDYDYIPGHGYYKFHKETKKWHEALQTCVSEEAHLLILNSEAEAKAVIPVLAKHPKTLSGWQNSWTAAGLHDFFADGKFITILGEPVEAAGYNKWYSGEPSGGTSQQCGVVHESAVYGDSPCQEPLFFVCEQDL